MPSISINNIPLYFHQEGEGDLALVFVHGAGLDHTVWQKQYQALSKTHTCIGIDLNGHNKSEFREGDGLATYTQDVISVLEHLDQPSVVIGHSLGGAIAINLALKRPKYLVGIGLVGTGARLRVLPSLLQLFEDDMDGGVDYLLGLEFFCSLPDVVQATRARMISNGQNATLRDFNACDSFNAMSQLSTFDLPAWVCVGEHDQLTPPKYAEYLKQKIKNAHLDIIADAGHMTMLEQPQTFNARLRGFLNHL